MNLNQVDNACNGNTAISTENLILSVGKQPVAGKRKRTGTQSERRTVNFCVKQREYRIHG